MKASFYELSYTIGQNWSLGLAIGLVGNGMGNIETSDARYETIKTSGAYYTGVLGGAIAGFEGLLGYQALQLKYSDLKNNADGSSLSTPFEIKGGLFLFGLDLSNKLDDGIYLKTRAFLALSEKFASEL